MNEKRTRKSANSTPKGEESKGKGNTSIKLILPTVLLLIIGVVVQVIFRNASASFFEGAYLYVANVVSSILGFLPSLISVSITEIAGLLLIITLLILLVITIKRIVQKRIHRRSIASFFCIVLFIASIVFNLFNFAWGGYYYRKPLFTLLNYDNYNGVNYMEKQYSAANLHWLCLTLRNEANSLSTQVHRDEKGYFHIAWKEDYFNKIADSYATLKAVNPKGRKVEPAKKLFCSSAMSILGISGLYMPIFAEANVNVDQPALLVFATAAHENAHALGFAREDEASFVGYLACMNTGDVNIRYSGVMNALVYASSALKQYDKENYTSMCADLEQGYSEQVSTDINHYNRYWSDKTTVISFISEKTNDLYLKANGVKNGAQNYGEFVQYLLVYSEINGGAPFVNSSPADGSQ